MNRLATQLLTTTLATCSTVLAQWGPIAAATPPSPRSEALLAYDLFANQILMIGGNFTNEFWSLSNNTWTQLTPATLPPARRRGNIGVDTFSGELLLYGGQDGTSSTAMDDSWLWNGTTWQQLTPTVTPGGLMWHGMAFDSVRSVTVAFGGRRDLWNQNSYLDETWEFSQTLNQWTQVFSAFTPPAATTPALCYHPFLNKIMSFGGKTGASTASDETWVYDGVWTQINTTGVTPPARSGAQLLANFSRTLVVLVGGRDAMNNILNDTWEHDGTQWREITNIYGGIYPPRAEMAMAHDLMRDRLVSFGGKVANNGLRNDTWEYGAQWQPFGMGCAGSNGTPTLTPGTPPNIGGVASLQIGNTPLASTFAFVSMGLSRTQWALGNLPALLDGLGMPGCRTYTSADLLVTIPASNGTATWTWNVPAQSILLGEALYMQGVTFDPGLNALGLAVSPAATMVIGN